MGGQIVQLRLSVRRFYCHNSRCKKRTFTEQFPDLLSYRTRRTKRLLEAQRAVGVALGGEAGARLLTRLAMPISPDTTLRLVRKIQVAPPATPRVLGVDDWALRKGRTYGTILVDLEKHKVVDLLPDRTSETLSTWLREHPGVEILTRDRSTEYAKAAGEGAPQAEQVADRWHLLLNIRQMLERYLPGVYERLKQLPGASAADLERATSRRTRAYRRTGAEAVASRESRKRRLARFGEVKRLYAAGKNLSVISRELALDIKTVRTYAYADAFPERTRQPGPSILDPYLSYLNMRHQAGCENASQLWREIVQQGFPGSKRQVLKWMQETRRTPAPTTPGRYLERVRAEKKTAVGKPGAVPRLPSAKHLAWLFIQEPAKAPGKNAPILARVLQDTEVAHVYALARTFVDLVRYKRPEALDTWLEGCAASSVNALRTFAVGIQQDYKAVRSALELPWSNAQTEGQVTRLKFIKRMMYGRANFDLLRQRVLLAA